MNDPNLEADDDDKLQINTLKTYNENYLNLSHY
jgi:hypothetical protein